MDVIMLSPNGEAEAFYPSWSREEASAAFTPAQDLPPTSLVPSSKQDPIQYQDIATPQYQFAPSCQNLIESGVEGSSTGFSGSAGLAPAPGTIRTTNPQGKMSSEQKSTSITKSSSNENGQILQPSRNKIWTSAILADLANEVQASFDFAAFGARHGRSSDEVFDLFSAVVQMPLFECSVRGLARARSKEMRAKVKDYQDAVKRVARDQKEGARANAV